MKHLARVPYGDGAKELRCASVFKGCLTARCAVWCGLDVPQQHGWQCSHQQNVSIYRNLEEPKNAAVLPAAPTPAEQSTL